MRTGTHPDGSSYVECSSISKSESTKVRAALWRFAETTFLQQSRDWLDVRRRAKEAASPDERRRCREAVKDRPPPSFDDCLDYARRNLRKAALDVIEASRAS